MPEPPGPAEEQPDSRPPAGRAGVCGWLEAAGAQPRRLIDSLILLGRIPELICGLLRFAFAQTQSYGANNRKMHLREQLNPTIVHSMDSVACTYQREHEQSRR